MIKSILLELLYPAHVIRKDKVMDKYYWELTGGLTFTFFCCLFFMPLNIGTGISGILVAVILNAYKVFMFSINGVDIAPLEDRDEEKFIPRRKRSSLVWLIIWMGGLIIADEAGVTLFGFTFITLTVVFNIFPQYVSKKSNKKPWYKRIFSKS